MFVFVHAHGIKTVYARGGGAKNWQNSVHVVVECPLTQFVKLEDWTPDIRTYPFNCIT